MIKIKALFSVIKVVFVQQSEKYFEKKVQIKVFLVCFWFNYSLHCFVAIHSVCNFFETFFNRN